MPLLPRSGRGIGVGLLLRCPLRRGNQQVVVNTAACIKQGSPFGYESSAIRVLNERRSNDKMDRQRESA